MSSTATIPETAYFGLKEAMDYVRTERKPFLLEAMVSRLYGHSSSSGANLVTEEVDCLAKFEARLEDRGIMTRGEMEALHPGNAHNTFSMLRSRFVKSRSPPPNRFGIAYFKTNA